MYFIPTACLLLTLAGVQALYEDCDRYQELQPNIKYYIYNKEYPSSYKPGSSCRWYAVAPAGTTIFLQCEKMNIPPSQDCFYDKLRVSKSGDVNFRDGETYCGDGRLGILSTGNKMNIALVTSEYSPGGSILCTIRAQPSCDCGWQTKNRIVGGTETQINEYPLMVGIVDVSIYDVFCGGSIISQRYVLTAAHCLLGKTAAQTGLLVGEHDYSTGAETNSSALYRAQRFISHPQYHTVSQANDIALIQSEKPIVYRREVGPACLPYTNLNPMTGQEVTALGWGSLGHGEKTSTKLRKVDLEVTNQQTCQASYQALGYTVTSNQICTYRPGKDACQSDSGGPIVWFDQPAGKVKLVGIISFGIRCATSYPGVNTRVASHTDWIEQTTNDQFCVV